MFHRKDYIPLALRFLQILRFYSNNIRCGNDSGDSIYDSREMLVL